MPKATDKTTAQPQPQPLHYTGLNGAWFVNVPARDLSADEVTALLPILEAAWGIDPADIIARLTETGVYTVAKDD